MNRARITKLQTREGSARDLEPGSLDDPAADVVNDDVFDASMDVVLEEYADELRELTT